MKIATFTDHISTPSSRFRIRQFFHLLEESGITVHDYYRRLSTQTAASSNGDIRIRNSLSLTVKAVMHESTNILSRFYTTIESNKYDAIWLSRQLIIGYPSFERLIRKPLIYDIDDAVYLTGPAAYHQFKISSQMACEVIAGNDYLAEECSKYCQNVSVVPTAVDTHRWKPSEKNIIKECASTTNFRIGWSGTSSSYKYFIPIEREILKFILDYPSVRLLFMADRFPSELKLLSPFITFYKWSTQDEVAFIQSLDVGLMPISDDKYSNGKCAYKMLLYAACGVPSVVTPTGVNKKILEQSHVGFGPNTPEEWYESLVSLYADRSLVKILGENAVDLVRREYSIDICAPKIINIIKRSV